MNGKVEVSLSGDMLSAREEGILGVDEARSSMEGRVVRYECFHDCFVNGLELELMCH